MKQKLKVLFGALALVLVAPFANAGQILNCTIGDFAKAQGTAQIEILSVVDHPELKLFKIDVVTHLQNPTTNQISGGGTVHLKGILAAQLHPRNQVLAQGTLYNAGGDEHFIINPLTVNLQGSIESNGDYELRLYDGNQQIQLGYGVRVLCR